MVKQYESAFQVGDRVRVASLVVLECFQKSWRLHNPLQTNQLYFAQREATVAQVGFYHGGDPLYVLEGVPGVWHEACLERS
jgi:hypothetical protein